MKNLFVPLDIFHKTMENKDINTELEAWLTFLSTDDPELKEDTIQSQSDELEKAYALIEELQKNQQSNK